MIQVKIITFGVVRDMVGGHQMVEEVLPEGATVDQLHALLTERYPALRRLDNLRYAVNARYARGNTPINAIDEIALIPPVSGG